MLGYHCVRTEDVTSADVHVSTAPVLSVYAAVLPSQAETICSSTSCLIIPSSSLNH